MNSPRKILLIDSAADRKERIRALSKKGYSVFPARKMEEAHSRCMRGGYDLILVNASTDETGALEFCDDIQKQCPKQLLLMCTTAGAAREYAVSVDLPQLLRSVDNLLHEEAKPADYASAA